MSIKKSILSLNKQIKSQEETLSRMLPSKSRDMVSKQHEENKKWLKALIIHY